MSLHLLGDLAVLIKGVDIPLRILIVFTFEAYMLFDQIYLYYIRLWESVCALATAFLFPFQFTMITENEDHESKKEKLRV